MPGRHRATNPHRLNAPRLNAPRLNAPRLNAQRTWWWPYLVIAVLAALLAGVTTTHGGFTASIRNTGNLTRTGSLLTAAAAGGTTECDLSTAANNPITDTNSATCTGDLTPALATDTATTSLNTTVSDRGSLNATSATLTGGACGAIQLANNTTAGDPMLVRGSTLSYAATGPLAGSTGLGLSGTSGFAADVTKVTPPTANFTEAIWFKAPNGATTGGTIMGFTNTPSNNSPGQWDRMIWLDNTGRVVFGAYNGGVFEATTTTKYNDGAWHLAVATLSSTAGMALYIDNAAAVTNTNKAAEGSTGYWHVGWDNVTNGWTNPPTNAYFTGTLANAAILPTALTSAQVSTLYGSGTGTQAAWSTRLAALSPTYSWTLGDDGTTPYTGTVPSVTPAACDFIDITVGASTTATACAYPTSTTACAAPATASRLSGLANTTKSFGVSPTTSQTMTVTTSIARDTTNTVAANPYAAGLHITLPLTITCAAGGFTAKLQWAGQDMLL